MSERRDRGGAPSGDPWLLTPGPLTTSPGVKAAMLHDFGSRDPSFIAVNAQIREHALASPIVERLEHCIDSLRRLLPELNEDHVGSELTWTVNRMATDYLARIVTPFVALAPSARGEHEPELLRSLEGVDAELDNIAELLHNARVGEFKTKAAFLRARFLDADLG